MKRKIKIIFTSLFISIVLIAVILSCYKNYNKNVIRLSNNKVFKYKVRHIPEQAFDDYCFNLIEENIKSIEDKSYKYITENINNLKPELKECLNILNDTTHFDFTNTTMISFAGSYWRKAEILLNSYINLVEKNFNSDKKFISIFKNKIEEIDKQTENIIKQEFPFPDEGRETHIFLYSRQAELKYEKLAILQGLVANYCLENFEKEQCKIFMHERNGELKMRE